MRSAKVKWLLLADIHFKHQDLDRITQTAAWITSVAARHQVHRVVVCGDLLTTRSSQPTHVLSACYRFLASLVHDARVPHVHVVLGNHDLAYRRDLDHATSALDALRLAAPAVQLHWNVGAHVWDGRCVLTLPFREDQSELTDAVAALRRDEAAETVAFAHLAVHKAITQRYVVRPSSDVTSRRTGSVAYHGLMGPGYFSGLARTFTGHFHSHQTILQQPPAPSAREILDEGAEAARLRGSVTYVGSPLQLTWADLWDEQRGVILLDPETLDHELLPNPNAVGFTTARVEEVLDDAADQDAIQGKHVMLLGDLTRFRYAAARDKLVSLGARSIRSWSPIAPRFQGTIALRGLGASTPASDVSRQQPNLEPENDVDEIGADAETTAMDSTDLMLAPTPPQPQQVDIREQVVRYVEALDLDKSLKKSQGLLVQLGQRLLEAAASDQAEEESQALGDGQSESLDYKSIIPPRDGDKISPPAAHMGTMAKTSLGSRTVFDAQPRSLTITNFLGIQSTIHLNFGTDIPRGLTFLVGENGSGKSTLIEAMVWCQFGRCLRSGLGANDVVNDVAKRDCSVRMEFDNGYAITRCRKHKELGNRIIVERYGKVLPEFEKADIRSTQAAIDELLCMSYNTFVRTVVLGHESATSFLSSTPAQRRDLILSVLGLEILDRCATTTRRMMRKLDDDVDKVRSRLDGLEQTMNHVNGRIRELVSTQSRLEGELEQTELEREQALLELETTTGLDSKDTAALSMHLDEQISAAHQQVEDLLHLNKLADIRRAFEEARLAVQDQRLAMLQRLTELEGKHSQLSLIKPKVDAEPVGESEGQPAAILSWLLKVFTGMRKSLQSIEAGLKPSLQQASPPALRQRIAGHSVRILLMSLCRVSDLLGKMTGADSRHARMASKAGREQELDSFRVALEAVERDITEQRQQLSLLQSLGSELHIIQQLASEKDMLEQDVRDSLEKVSTSDAKIVPAQLNAALTMLADLQSQRQLHAAKQARLGELKGAMKALSEKLATYEDIIDTESAARRDLNADRDILLNEMTTLAADRDLLDFWASALAQKSRRVSSSSSLSSSATSSYTFREFVLEQSLAELNTVTTQILAILFEDSRHATALTTGMLRSLFVGDKSAAGETANGKEEGSAALDSSLSVDARLSYGKRSGGERKRIDLALFFALLYVGHARSPHRAHYMLVDEVFDSLDAAGQAAVVRWCDFTATARVAHLIIITHSEHLVSQGVAAGESEQDQGAGRAVLTARVGEAGVELEMDGKSVG